MILESVAALVGLLITHVGTTIESKLIDAIINLAVKRQHPSLTSFSSLTGLEGSIGALQRGQEVLLSGQRAMRADQRRQIEEHYKSGIDLLGSARRTSKKKYKIRLIQDAIKAFISAKNTERGEAAAKAALLVGACHHLLYCINDKYGTSNENFYYEEALQLANQSRGPDGKPPFELIEELLKLPYLKNKDAQTRYWIQHPGEQKVWGETNGYTKTQMLEFIAQRVVLPNTLVNINRTEWLPANQVVAFQQALEEKHEPKLIEAPKVVDTLEFLQSPYFQPSQGSALGRYQKTPSKFGDYNQECLKCGETFYVPPGQLQLYCPKCKFKPRGMFGL